MIFNYCPICYAVLRNGSRIEDPFDYACSIDSDHFMISFYSDSTSLLYYLFSVEEYKYMVCCNLNNKGELCNEGIYKLDKYNYTRLDIRLNCYGIKEQINELKVLLAFE